jgi:hypothetical protein
VSEIVHSCKSLRRSTWHRPPLIELIEWWGRQSRRFPSKNVYRKCRIAWAQFSKNLHGATAIGRSGHIVNDEFAVFEASFLAQAIQQDPEDAADAILRTLASYLAVDAADAGWTASVSQFRSLLSEDCKQLRSSVPDWLVSAAARGTDALRWGDCIPTTAERNNRNPRNWLAQLPRIEGILRSVEVERDAALQTLWQCVLVKLYQLRQDLEDTVHVTVRDVAGGKLPGDPLFTHNVQHLLGLIDEYENAAASLVVPFAEDPLLMPLSLDVSVLPGVGGEKTSAEIAEDARAELDTA